MFQNKVCIITGGANGIGRCMVEEFNKKGCKVAFIDNDQTAGEQLLTKLNSSDNLFVHGDIAKKETLEEFVKLIIDKYEQIDYLINNACYSNRGLLSDCTYEQFTEVIQVGVTAPYYLTLLLKDRFKEKGSIINISSTRAQMSQKDTESYSAAKGAISALTHAMAISLAGKVRVNSISPGWIDTTAYHMAENKSELDGISDKEQHPSKRIGTPYDIARMVMFMCEEDSDFINGENITIDGGMTKLMVYNGEEGWNYESD